MKYEAGKNVSQQDMRNLVDEAVPVTEVAEDANGERGSAIVIALLIMALLTIFVAATLSRTATESTIMGNDSAEARSYSAAQASLETMSRNFNKIFDIRLAVTTQDITDVQTTYPDGFPGFTFDQRLRRMGADEIVTIKDGPFEGLNALRDPWLLDTSATDRNGVQVRLRRTFLNNRIPIFQFGIFYNDDMELSPGARFDFGGRVHANGHMFLRGGGRVNFSSRVTSSGEIVVDVARNGWSNSTDPALANAGFGDNIFIKDGDGVYQRLAFGNGSVLGGPDVAGTDPDMPDGSYNSAKWKSASANSRINVTPINDIFDGNLIARIRKLELPLRLGRNTDGDNRQNNSYIELIKRGRLAGDLESILYPKRYINTAGVQIVDDEVVQLSRYYNKPGIRVSLADSKSRLPGCNQSNGTAVTTACGIRLDGAADGQGGDKDNAVTPSVDDDYRGYQPVKMADNYEASRLNGFRMYTGTSYDGQPRQTWIKIELVTVDQSTLAVTTRDITADILSLGVTERLPEAPAGSALENYLQVSDNNYYKAFPDKDRSDSRAIIKLQRLAIPGPIMVADSDANGNFDEHVPRVGTQRLFSYVARERGYNIVRFNKNNYADSDYMPGGDAERKQCRRDVDINKAKTITSVNGVTTAHTDDIIVPVPIEMFDAREGLPNEYYGMTSPYENSQYRSNNAVPVNGVMSMVDIDVDNLRRLVNGEFNNLFPNNGTAYTTATGGRFTSAAIPTESVAGAPVNSLIMYVSDRRGDADFDGELDMEDVYGPNDGILQTGEDVNYRCDVLNADGTCNDANKPAFNSWEGDNYNVTTDVATASVMDHRYYRRGVRLINGSRLPGNQNNGFSFASENGVYIFGNYNATGVTTAPILATDDPTPADNYSPSGAAGQVPASVIADAVTVISNPWDNTIGTGGAGWSDAASFASPFLSGTYTGINGRPARETTVRAAILMGDTISSTLANPNQGGYGAQRLNGSVNNFKRFLEDWSPVSVGRQRMNYCGSLINLFNSRNNNGTFKYGMGRVYDAPLRNWTFDTSFLDAQRMPPGTPFFQYLQLTGFTRVNEEMPLP